MKSLFINALLASSVAFLLGGASSAGSVDDDQSTTPSGGSRSSSMERKKAKTERERSRKASCSLLVPHKTPVGVIPLHPNWSGIFGNPLEILGMRDLPVFDLPGTLDDSGDKDDKSASSASDEWETPKKSGRPLLPTRSLRGLWGSPPTKSDTSNRVSFLSFQLPPPAIPLGAESAVASWGCRSCCESGPWGGVGGFQPAHPDGPSRQNVRRFWGLESPIFGSCVALTDTQLVDPAVAEVHTLLEPLRQQHLEKTGILTRVRETGHFSADDDRAFAAYYQACIDLVRDTSYGSRWKYLALSSRFIPIESISSEFYGPRASYPRRRGSPSFTYVAGVNAGALSLSHRAQGGFITVSSTFDGLPFGAVGMQTKDYVTSSSQGAQTVSANPEEAIVGKFFQSRAFSAAKDQPLLADLPEAAFANGMLMPSSLTKDQKGAFLEALRIKADHLGMMARWTEGPGGPVLLAYVGAPCFLKRAPLSDDDDNDDVEISTRILEAQYKAAAMLAAGRSLVTGQRIPFHVTLVEKETNNPTRAIENALKGVVEAVQGCAVDVYFHARTADDLAVIQAFSREGQPDVRNMNADAFFAPDAAPIRAPAVTASSEIAEAV